MAAFVDDIGNMGGRDRYIERMICHQERMSNIKPVVRIEAPKHCFEGGTRKTPRPSSAGVARGEFGEVREAFKRILSARPAVDTSTPRGAAEMAQRLSRNRTLGAKQQRYVAEQHERNMKHMARRIANSGSLTERKKNKLDPTLYPPWLLRREILPNIWSTLIAEFGVRFCFVFLFIAALSFLGIGIQPPTADWGSMVKENATLISFGDITPLIPAAAIALLTVAINLIVDWMLHRASGLKS